MRPFFIGTAVVGLLAGSILSGCSVFNGKPKPVPLAGTRINITASRPDALQPMPGADAEPVQLPAQLGLLNWSQSGGNSSHYLQHVQLPRSVARAWSYAINGRTDNTLINPPVVHSGRLFAINTRAEVVALDNHTGKQLWRTALTLEKPEAARIGGGLAVQGDLLFVTTASGQVFALTASTGKPVWDVKLDVPLRAAPTVDGTSLYVVSQDNRLFTLSALDGSLQWTHSGTENILSMAGAAAPAVANGVVVVPYSNGEIFVLRATDGRTVWQDTLASPYTGQDPDSTVSSITGAPVVADGLVYAVGVNGGLSAYGLANGQRFWRADLTTGQQPWVAGMQIYALTDRGELTALNRKDGTIRWVTDLNAGLDKDGKKPDAPRLWSGPVLAGDRLIVASSNGEAVSVNPANGQRMSLTDLGDGVSVTPVAADEGLYFLTGNGKVIAFRQPQ